MVVRLLTAALLLLVFVPTASAADKAWAHEAKGAREALARSVGAGYITPAEEADYLGVLECEAFDYRTDTRALRADAFPCLLDVAARHGTTLTDCR